MLKIFRQLAKFYWTNKISWIIFIAPLTLMFIPIFIPGPEAQCAFVLALMSVYLVTEVLPMAITGLLPILFIPLFGIVPSKRLASCYMEDFMVLFLCSMAIASLMEKTNFHKRIALNTMLLVGEDTGRLLFGFTFVTWFFSMWMNNTATAAMVLPIAEAMVEQMLKDLRLQRIEAISRARNQLSVLHGANHDITELDGLDNHDHIKMDVVKRDDLVINKEDYLTLAVPTVTTISEENSRNISEIEKFYKKEEARIKKMQKMLILAVAYTSLIGGVVTITGTSTNLILIGALEAYPGHPLTFSTWITFTLPMSFVIWLTNWVWMLSYYCGISAIKSAFICKGRKPGEPKSSSRLFLENEITALGKFSFEEGCTLFYFLAYVALLMSRDIGGVGWSQLFLEGYVTETQAGVAIVTLCCITPALSKVKLSEVQPSETEASNSLQTVVSDSRPTTPSSSAIEIDREEKYLSKFLLTWNDISKTVSWDLYFLIGGGMAISLASQESGLSDWIGEQLSVLGSLPPELILTIICFFSAALTQVMSNAAVCSIMMPILLSMADGIGINPLYIMFPATLACSFAFLLPIATPPNTLAYATGLISTFDMIKAGSVINVLAIGILIVFVITYGQLFIPYDVIPPVFIKNVTSAAYA